MANNNVNKGKVIKILSKSFVDSVQEMNEDQLKEAIIKSEIKIKEIENEQKNDSKLTAAKEIVKDLSSGYRDATTYEKSKITFLLDNLKELRELPEVK